MRLFKRRGEDGPKGYYYAQWFDPQGKRHQRSTRQTDKRAAEAVAREWERQSADPVYAAATQTTLESALVALIVEGQELSRAGKLAASTVRTYRTRAGHFVRILGHNARLASVDACAVDKYLSARRLDGASEHTLAKELAQLRKTLRLAKRRGTWHGDIDAVIPARFDPNYTPRIRVLSAEELSKLLGTLLPDRAARVAFMVATSAEYGATERALRVDVGRDSVKVRGSKTELRDRTVPVVAEFQKSLIAYALQHAEGTKGKLFRPWARGSYIRDLHAACARAGIPECSPNDFRRTLATWLREAGVPAELVSPLLGHCDTQMVERVYGRIRPDALANLLRTALGDCSLYAADSADAAGFMGPLGQSKPHETPSFQRAMQESNLRPLAPEANAHAKKRLGFEWSAPRCARTAADVQRGLRLRSA